MRADHPMHAVAPRSTRQGAFWIGTELTPTEHGHVVVGAMHVQWEAPAEGGREIPLVLVHGGGGQATDWLHTPDGRPGWASLLVDAGHVVHVVDRPGHGRSPFAADGLGPMTPQFPLEAASGLFAGVGVEGADQWPGDGSADDDALRQMLAGSGPMRVDVEASQELERRRLVELLERIGPAVVVAHSLGGPAGFLVADARPDLVRALIAVEPFGPPFHDDPQLGVELAWGLTTAPVTYDPPAATPAELHDGTPRRLTALADVPMAYVSAEASLFRGFDEASVDFLRARGCAVDLLRLDEHGVHGNGHAMMLERNSREVLRPILAWLDGLAGVRPAGVATAEAA